MRLALLLICTLSMPALAQVYTWKDESGTTHFGSQPPTAEKQEVIIRDASPGRASAAESDIMRQSRELDRRKREQRLEAAKSRYERRISEIGSDQEDRPGYVCTGAKNRLESARERWDSQKLQGYTLSEKTRHEQRIRDAQRHRDNICR